MDFLDGAIVKNLPASSGDARDTGLTFESERLPWRRKWHSTPIFLPGKSHGQRNLAGCSPLGCKELDMTEYACMYAVYFNRIIVTLKW